MFKMEVWETLLMSMRIGEVAEFWCDAVHTGLYPIVSKGMRLIAQGKDPLEGQRHMCGMGNMFHYHSTGFPELDELMRTPQPLIFIMELLQVGDPMSYHRESWMMDKDEKLHAVPTLHMQGNVLVKQGQFKKAASKYKEAVLLLKTIQSREMPGDVDYINLGRMIVPLELNYCQCMLELEEYYEVIERTTELLEKHKDCVKGYYKRAKAHAAVWNEKEARKDFNMVSQLDITLASLVRRELNALSERMKEKYWEEKEKYWNKLGKKEIENEKEEEEEGDAEGNGKADAENQEEIKCSKVKREKSSEESPTKGFESKEEVPKNNKDSPSEKSSIRKEKSSPTVTPNLDDEYQEKGWQQMLRVVMLLQNEGNFLITEKRFQEASEKFKQAVEYVDFLQKKISEEDADSLEKVRLPLTLNLSQCMLELDHYQQVVELNNKVLQKHKGNFKAVYQRARAHAALCNEEEARQDFELVLKLDPKFKPIVHQELRRLADKMRTMHAYQNKTYWDTTQEKWGPDGNKARSGTRKKKVKFSQNVIKHSEADPRSERDNIQGCEEAEKAPPVEVENVSDAERKTSLEQCSKEVDNKNKERTEVQDVGPGKLDKDSDPTATGLDKENVKHKRSARDKRRKKGKCQSNPATTTGTTKPGKKESSGKTAGKGLTPLE
uniref:Uncharacterized LOC114470789 n=1 Tax=Gouania willdenowi TaxID=441366 RepID=A0A8C5GWN4_GOUWI